MFNVDEIKTTYDLSKLACMAHRSVMRLVYINMPYMLKRSRGKFKLELKQTGGRPSEFAHLSPANVVYLILMMKNTKQVVNLKADISKYLANSRDMAKMYADKGIKFVYRDMQ